MIITNVSGDFSSPMFNARSWRIFKEFQFEQLNVYDPINRWKCRLERLIVIQMRERELANIYFHLYT